MVADEEGFLYPQINEKKCTNCYLCKRTCPVLNTKYDNKTVKDCYAAAFSDELREESSSGAIVAGIAEKIIQEGGVVAGVAYAEDMTPVNIFVDNIADLKKIKSSKYVQSTTGYIYKETKEYLNNGRKVLFTGTPCQVAALKAYLGKDYDNLLTIDIICHGVPSQKVFKKDLRERFGDEEKYGKILNINFRDKNNIGWNCGTTTTTTIIGDFTDNYNQEPYYDAFLNSLLFRTSCKTCPFNHIPRQGDITTGDFWGVPSKYNDKKGTSVVLLNNLKGEKTFEEIKHDLKICKKFPVKKAIKINSNIIKPSLFHHNRDAFYKDLDNMTIAENVRKHLNDSYDCAIINFWWTLNYGALLVAYALNKVITDLGYTCKFIDYKKHEEYEYWYKRYSNSFTDKFANKYLKLTDKCKKNSDIENVTKNARILMLGSDQTATQHNYPYINNYYLNFGHIKQKRMFLIVSITPFNRFIHLEFFKYINFVFFKLFSKNLFNPQKILDRVSYYIKNIDYVSVREKYSTTMLKNVFGVETDWLIDTIYLLEKKEYEKLINNATDKNYCKDKIVSFLIRANKKDYKKVYKYLENKYDTKVVETAHKNISVEDWITSIKNCKFIITDSYHAMNFAIIFNKPFIVIDFNNNIRFSSLFELFNIEDKRVKHITDIINNENLFADIDYNNVEKIIKNERDKALKILEEQLATPKELTNEKIANYISLKEFQKKEETYHKTIDYKFKKFVYNFAIFLYPYVVKYIIKRKKK